MIIVRSLGLNFKLLGEDGDELGRCVGDATELLSLCHPLFDALLNLTSSYKYILMYYNFKVISVVKNYCFFSEIGCLM